MVGDSHEAPGSSLTTEYRKKRFLFVQAEQDPLGLKNFQAPYEIGSRPDSHIFSIRFVRCFFFYSHPRRKLGR